MTTHDTTTVERIDRVPIELPFQEVPARNMARENPHWRYFEIVEVELASGDVGHGETMLFYSWGRTDDEDVERAIGANAAKIMWDDSLGPGLQIALFDAVGRALGVPVYGLLGKKVREQVPLSWWCIDMDVEDWLVEAWTAIDRGYTDLKVKGRPWFDIREQVETLDEELPDWFGIDVDFNGTLIDAERGLPILEELTSYDVISHVEGPILQENVDGNRRITRKLDVPIALHYGRPEPRTAICLDICDGFVVSGGASALRDSAAVAAIADAPFWLQLVGTGITAAFSLHCGGVLERASWPAINCHQIYEHDLLADPIVVDDGVAAVPDEPGLGHDVDMDVVESYRTEKPDSRPYPLRIIEVDWSEGPTIYYSGNDNQLIYHAQDKGMPYFKRDVAIRMVPDDGTEEWESLAERVTDEPVVEEAPVV